MIYILITYEFPPMRGGIGQYLKNLADGLVQNGEEVHVFTHSAKAEEAVYCISKTRNNVSSRLLKNVILFIEIIRTLNKINKKDVICVAATWKDEGLIAFLLRKIYGIKYMVLCHGTEVTQYRRTKLVKIMERVFSNATMIIPNSRYTAKEVLKVSGTKIEKIEIINPPVNKKEEDICSAHKNDRLEKDVDLIILTVARLVERKGHLLILEAMNRIKKDKIRLKYYIVGTGEEEDRINKYIETEKMKDCVVMCGDLPDEDVGYLYSNTDLYISLSLNCNNDIEGFGLSVVEAALYGKPSIVGRGGGVEDAVENGVTGILVESNNVEEIEGALRSAIINTSEIREMGKRAKQRAEKEFAPVNIAKRFIDLCAPSL